MGDPSLRLKNGYAQDDAALRLILLKVISGFECAAIDSALIWVRAGVAVGPTQLKRRAQRKDDGLAIEVALHADAFRRRGKREGKSLAEDCGVGPVFHLSDHRTEYFGFHQERRGVGPIANREGQPLIALRQVIGLDSGKRARPRNTRCPY